MWAHLNNWGSQMYGAYGNPLVSQIMLSLCCVCTGGIQTYGGIQIYGGIETYEHI